MGTLEAPVVTVSARQPWMRWRVVGHPRRQLLLLFLLSLPLINPYVHGDGVGYYAYARAPLIQHNLRFEEDWRRANEYFAKARTQSDGRLQQSEYSATGYVTNIFTVGPAILWSPFLLLAHGTVLAVDHFGGAIPADGFSFPYRMAMAVGTAVYGFLGLFFSFLLASKYVGERWAFLATVGIWFATSLPVYMYFNPSWSHAHSAFVVALFLWYWDRTRPERSLGQWLLLGLIAGLMLDTYFPNGVFLLIPLVESVRSYFRSLRSGDVRPLRNLFGKNVLFLVALIAAISPTLITRSIIFGSPFRFGAYGELPWNWSAPFWRLVLFSSDHGLLVWTPVVAFALIGLLLADGNTRETALYCGMGALAYYYVIASYPYWDGFSSFGNRFFISLTPVFVFGLAILLSRAAERIREPRVSFVCLASLLAAFVLWNAGFIFQWGTHLIPVRGPISWSEMARNQVSAVPREIADKAQAYLFRRSSEMHDIEQRDMQQISGGAQAR
jgi:hypothetical protein